MGEFEHPAYGSLKIGQKSDQLQFDFHKIVCRCHTFTTTGSIPRRRRERQVVGELPTNPQGDVEEAVMSLDQAEATFKRKPEKLAPAMFTQMAGEYQTPTGTKVQVKYQEASGLSLVFPGRLPFRWRRSRVCASARRSSAMSYSSSWSRAIRSRR